MKALGLGLGLMVVLVTASAAAAGPQPGASPAPAPNVAHSVAHAPTLVAAPHVEQHVAPPPSAPHPAFGTSIHIGTPHPVASAAQPVKRGLSNVPKGPLPVRSPNLDDVKVSASFVAEQHVSFVNAPDDLRESIRSSMGGRNVVATSGYSAPPAGYGEFSETFMKSFGAATGTKAGFLTSPTADAGSIDAATTLAAQSSKAPIRYITADGYLQYVKPESFPAGVDRTAFSAAPKVSFPDGETYSKATGQLSNSSVILGGRNAAVTDWMHGVANGNRVAVAGDLPIANAAWDPNKGRVDNASAYLKKMIAGDHEGIDMNHPFNKEVASFVAAHKDEISRNVKVVSGSPQKAGALAAAWVLGGH